MKGRLIIGLFVLLLSCNPYESYPYTHYYIQATIEPDQARISANLQMVFRPTQEYHDSICFTLNPGMEIHSLTAQELMYYEFNKRDTGNLVLYIQEPVYPSEQLQIAISYSGELDKQPVLQMDSRMFWYPINSDTRSATFHAKFALPGNWQISSPPTGMGKHGKWLFETRLPQPSLNIIFTAR